MSDRRRRRQSDALRGSGQRAEKSSDDAFELPGLIEGKAVAGVWDLLNHDPRVDGAELGGEFGCDDRRVADDEQGGDFNRADESSEVGVGWLEHTESAQAGVQEGLHLGFDDFRGTVWMSSPELRHEVGLR